MHMKIDIATKNIDLDQPLRVWIEDKIGGLEQIAQELGELHVRVEIGKPSQHHHKGPVFYAEANFHIGTHTLRAEATHEDLRAAIIDVKEELHLQIKKFKEKIEDKERESLPEA